MVPAAADVDFTGATVLRLSGMRRVGESFTVEFYEAKIAPGSRFAVVDWGVGYEHRRFEIVFPGEDGRVPLSHVYPGDIIDDQVTVRITDDLSELRFSGAEIRPPVNTSDKYSVGELDVKIVNEFTGASKLREVVNVGAKVNRVLARGMFANTGITAIPSGYALPSLTSRKTAPCVPLACFMNCTSLSSLDNLPPGAVAIDALAFSGCTSLAGLSGLSSSPGLVHIGYAAFRGCTSLASLSGLSCTLTAYAYETLFGPWTDMDGVLAELYPGVSADYKYGYRVDQFMFPLGSEAFRGCTKLTDISQLHVSGGFLLVGTFSGCSRLASVPTEISSMDLGFDTTHWTTGSSWFVVPGGYRYFNHRMPVKPADQVSNNRYLRWFSGGVFDGTAITDLPYKRTVILDKEFAGCTSLTSITLADGVDRVGADSFSGCTALAAVTFPGRTMEQVRNMFYPTTGTSYWKEAYPFGLKSGCVITCSDGTITV